MSQHHQTITALTVLAFAHCVSASVAAQESPEMPAELPRIAGATEAPQRFRASDESFDLSDQPRGSVGSVLLYRVNKRRPEASVVPTADGRGALFTLNGVM